MLLPNGLWHRDRRLKQIDELAIALRNRGRSLVACHGLALPADQRIPEAGPADREADEPLHRCGDLEPVADFLLVLTAPENDAAYVVAAAGPRRRHDQCTILAAIHPFDFPDIGLHAGVMQFADGGDHQLRP